MAVVKVIELVGTSTESWEHAVRQAVEESARTLRNISGVDVIRHTAHVENGRITEYRATVHLAFRVEREAHLMGVE
jgi:dodecin